MSTTTGERPALQPTVTGEHPATNLEVRTVVTLGVLKNAIVAVVAVFLAGWATYATVTHAAEQTVDAGLVPLRVRVEALEQGQASVREDIGEVQRDIRALYKAVVTGQRQERLEQPVDGGGK